MTCLVATWSNGLFELADSTSHVFAGKSVGALTRSASGRVLAIVQGTELVERIASGEWQTIATADRPLSCIACSGDQVFAGTDDAAILKLTSAGELRAIEGFADVGGREHWYAGTAVINGEVVGPPLGVRSMTATADASALLANVHVGGIARSADNGRHWVPTIDIDYDVHEVSAHPSRPDDVVAAAGVGLCLSTDGGRSWALTTDGLHAKYCSAARYCGDTIFVAASEHHFSPCGALYRRAPHTSATLERVSNGLPEWLDGIVDTACIGTLGSRIAIADRGGHIYESPDAGSGWFLRADGFKSPSAIILL